MHNPRFTSPELDLDRASSARRPPAAAPPPGKRRGCWLSMLCALAAVVLVAVVVMALFSFRRDAADSAAEWLDLSRYPKEMRPVVEYLSPSPAEAELWFNSIRTSTYVRQKWPKLADGVHFTYQHENDEINAFAGFANHDPQRPTMVLQGGLVRLSRLLGAVSLLQASARAQGIEKDIGTYFVRILQETDAGAVLSMDKVIDLLNEFEISTSAFEDVAAVSEAKSLANGTCKAVLGHEMGHLAGGHGLGADPNRTVSKNEESQADLFASSLAASMENGPYMLKGQIAFWFFLAMGEKQNPESELFRTHPYSAERLSAAVRANKILAASMGISLEDVEGLASAAAQIASAVATDALRRTAGADASDAGTSDMAAVESVSNVLESATAEDGRRLQIDAEEVDWEFSEEQSPKLLKSLSPSNAIYTEFGAVVRMSVNPNAQYLPRNPIALVRFEKTGGGLMKKCDDGSFQTFAPAGSVKIGGVRYDVFENPTGADRLFFSASGDALEVQNIVLSSVVILFDRGDTRRRRNTVGVRGGVSFPNVDTVVKWSLSQPIRVDPAAFSALDFRSGAAGGSGASGGSDYCVVCKGTGSCQICKGTGSVRMYGTVTPCERYCSSCGGSGKR